MAFARRVRRILRALCGRSVFFVPAVVACGPPSPPSAAAGIVVTSEPSASLGAIPPVVRLHVSGIGAATSALVLLDGELGSYHAARLRQGELPSTLVSRRIEALVWHGERGQSGQSEADAVLAPSVPLTPSRTYTLVALGVGPLETVVVDSTAAPVAERVWPPRSSVNGGARSVFCAAETAALGQGAVRLDPIGLDATAVLGTDGAGSSSDRCVHLDSAAPAPSGVVLPPPAMGDVAMDPAPIVLDPEAAQVEGLQCAGAEVAVGPGCADVMDDRAVVRSGGVPLLWSVRTGDTTRIEPSVANGRFVLRGLLPSTHVSVSGSATDLAGREASFVTVFATGPPRPHVVINEVLANPLGPEPAQEWVELLNDGAGSVDLTGFILSDGGGDTVLPPAVVRPGEYALVVGQGFALADGLDPPPAPGTLLLRVPHLGSSGLSNSGEALTLASADGKVISRFPAILASRPGVSVVRRDASALDDDREAFFPSRDGSATPGWENHIVSP